MKFSSLMLTDIRNKVVVITGANAGLGFEAACTFAARGAIVFGAVRSLARGIEAQQRITHLVPHAKISFVECDLARKHSIAQCAQHLIAMTTGIDILLNNAGVMAIPYELNDDGIEMQFAINHLGHFRLTALLFPHFNKHARIVNVSSMAHLQAKFEPHDPSNANKPYHSFQAYAHSKLANLLFTHALNEKISMDPRKLMAVSAHPGIAMTSLFTKVEPNSMFRKFKPLLRTITTSAKQGSKPIIMACIEPHAKPNTFYGPSLWRNSDSISLSLMSSYATQQACAQHLWNYSNQVTQLAFLD